MCSSRTFGISSIFHLTSKQFSPEETKNLESIRDHIQTKSLKDEPPLPEEDNLTIDQYLRNLGAGPKTLAMVNVWAKAMHGLEIDQYSAAWFIDYCRTNCGLLSVRADDHTGGNYLRFQRGKLSFHHRR